jgi:hypothetical protein
MDSGRDKPMANDIKCSDCSTFIPRTAKFCPRCGRSADAAPTHGEAVPVVNLAAVKSPIPKLGLLFLFAMLVGPTLALLGLYFGNLALLWCGAGLIGIVLLMMVLGIFL